MLSSTRSAANLAWSSRSTHPTTCPYRCPAARCKFPRRPADRCEINDDTIFNCIDKQLKDNPQVVSVDKPGLKMRTMPVPLPLPIVLRPSAASSGGYLFIAASDELINDALAVKSGQKAGLKTTDEFKHLAQGLPDHGNQFCYMSQRFADTLIKVQQQAMASSAKAEPQMAQWLQSFYRSRPAFAYSVGINTPEGCLTVGNGSQSYANMALLPPWPCPPCLPRLPFPISSRPGPSRKKTPALTTSGRLTVPTRMGFGKRQKIHRHADHGRSQAISSEYSPLPRRWRLYH